MDNPNESLVTFAVVTGSAINGIGASIFWVAQGKYLSDLVKICEDRQGLYSSLFWTIALGSQIFSYIFNSIILGIFDPFVLFVITASIVSLALIIFQYLPDPDLP